jgi:predicted nucleic acid-binding protein
VIYVDTCILIYALESDGPLGNRARSAIEDAPAQLAVSPLVVHELLVVPLRRGDRALIDRVEAATKNLTMIDMGFDDFIDASAIRARHPGLKLADALHLAAARAAGCSELWTNDSRLTSLATGFARDILSDV